MKRKKELPNIPDKEVKNVKSILTQKSFKYMHLTWVLKHLDILSFQNIFLHLQFA